MSSELENQDWLEALAGRAAPRSPGAREGVALRRALLTYAPDAPATGDADAHDVHREGQLVERARRAGLLAPVPDIARERQQRRAYGLIAAALAGFAVILGLYLQIPTPTSEVVRSSPDGVVRLVAQDPVKLKQDLIADLSAAGVDATGYELLGRQGVDADLPQPLSEAVSRVLAKYRIEPPADGVLRVEISRDEAQ